MRAALFIESLRERGATPASARFSLIKLSKVSAPELDASPLGFGFGAGVAVACGAGVAVAFGAGVAVAFGFGVAVAFGAFVGAFVGSVDGLSVEPAPGVVSAPEGAVESESDGLKLMESVKDSVGSSETDVLAEVSVTSPEGSEDPSVRDVVSDGSVFSAVVTEESARVGSLSSFALCFAQEDMAKTEMINRSPMVSAKGVFLSEVLCFFIWSASCVFEVSIVFII